MIPADPVRLLSIKDIAKITTLSQSTILRLVAAGAFPKPIKISPNRIAWSDSEVRQWMLARQ